MCLSRVFLHFLLKSCRSQVRSCAGQWVVQHCLIPCCHRYSWSLRKIKNAYLTCFRFANIPCFCEQRGVWRGRQRGAGLSVWNMTSDSIDHIILQDELKECEFESLIRSNLVPDHWEWWRWFQFK